MRSPSKTRRIALALLLGSALRLPAGEGDERIAQGLWRRHLEGPERHAEIAAACRDVEARLAGSPMLPICHGLWAWHLLRSGVTQEAVAVLGRLTEGASPAATPVAELMAKRWLTRLDRERVRTVLREAYRKDVQYPKTLERLKSLPGGDTLAYADRWEQPWAYAPAALTRIPGLAGQRYTLESARMPGASDLASELARPYAAPTDLTPTRMMSDSGSKLVEFTTGGERPHTAVVGEGGALGRYTLVFAGDRILIVSDSDRWYVLARPP